MEDQTNSFDTFTRTGKLLFKKYRDFFFPTILGTMSSSLAIIVDSVIVGNMLGAKEMASVNLCLPIVQCCSTLAVLVGMGAATLIAGAIGRHDQQTANKIFSISIILILLCGIILTALTLFFHYGIATLLTTDQELMPLVDSYLYVMLAGTLFCLIIPLFIYLVRVDGMARLASMVLIVSNLTNLMLDIIFIGPCGMGIGGSALATVCGSIAGTAFLIFYWHSNRRTMRFSLNSVNIRAFIQNAIEIVKMGSPGAISSILIAIKIFGINLLVGHVAGGDGLIVFSVCSSTLAFLFMLIRGTTGTMLPIVGILFGQDDFKGVRLIFNYTLRLALLLTIGMIVILELFPASILEIFGIESPKLLSIGIPSLRLYGLSLIGVTTSYILIYYYTAIQRYKLANMLSLIEGVLMILPTALLLSYFFGLYGIWVSFAVAEVLTLGWLYLKTQSIIKKSNGHYKDMLFIKSEDPDLVYDITLTVAKKSAIQLFEQTQEAMRQNGIEPTIALSAAIAIKEITDHTEHCNKRATIDIRINSKPQEIIISIRDDGKWFDPTQPHLETESTLIPADVLARSKPIASQIKYNRVMDLNQTMIVISKL